MLSNNLDYYLGDNEIKFPGLGGKLQRIYQHLDNELIVDYTVSRSESPELIKQLVVLPFNPFDMTEGAVRLSLNLESALASKLCNDGQTAVCTL